MNHPVSEELKFNVKMFNDIARNLGAGKPVEQAAEAVKNHVQRFWAPSMIDGLLAQQSEIESQLLPAARLALQQLDSRA